MPGRDGPRGQIHALDAGGAAVRIDVFWRRGSTYLRYGAHEHLVHPSNLRRRNGFAMEATVAFGVREAVYAPF